MKLLNMLKIIFIEACIEDSYIDEIEVTEEKDID